jgi:hypothetical protein
MIIGDTTGTLIDTGDIITTTGTAGKQEHTSCGTAEEGWLECLAWYGCCAHQERLSGGQWGS